MSLPFGMIFSIILIAAIIGIGFYTINYFVNLGKCTEIGLFYQDFQDKVDRAWNSEITRDEFVGKLPNGIKSVCFGDLSQTLGRTGKEYDALRKYRNVDANMFLYPPEKSCGLEYRKIEHVDFSELDVFSCFSTTGGQVRIKLEKGSFDALVKIKR